MAEGADKQPIWKNLGSRFVTALIMAAIALIPFYFGGIYWAIAIFLLAARALWEWVDMTDKSKTSLAYFIPLITLIAAVYCQVSGYGNYLYPIIGGGAVLAFAERILRKGSEPYWAPFGVIYVILPCITAIMLRGSEVGFEASGFKVMLYLMIAVMAADVGAYFGGSYFKGPKLAPKLSPKKTWSGLMSGIVFGVAFGALVGLLLKMGPGKAALLAIPIVLVSVFGDFLESGVKRRMNVKDASDLLPGHGGILDRVDSLLMVMIAAHIVYYFYNFMELV